MRRHFDRGGGNGCSFFRMQLTYLFIILLAIFTDSFSSFHLLRTSASILHNGSSLFRRGSVIRERSALSVAREFLVFMTSESFSNFLFFKLLQM